MSYATVKEFREYVDKTVTEDDQIIKALILTAGDAIDRFTGHYQQDARGNVIEAFNASMSAQKIFAGSGEAVQWIDECVAITEVAVKDSVTDSAYTAWTAGTDWLAFSGPSKNPNFNVLPYTGLMIAANSSYGYFTSGELLGPIGFPPNEEDMRRLTPTVRVTATWGYAAATPSEIKTACIMQAARMYKRMQGAMNDTMASVDFGELIYRQELDVDVKMLLVGSRYYKPAIGRR